MKNLKFRLDFITFMSYGVYDKDNLFKVSNMAKESEKMYFGIACTEKEKREVWKKLHKAAGDANLTVSDYFLRLAGIRKK